MLAPFEASRLKIARARRHIGELDRLVADYLGRSPVTIVVEECPWPMLVPTDSWIARINEPVPTDLAPVIGDAIHNLRTALDLLANDLVRLAGENTKGVYFPFAEHESGLQDQIKRKNFSLAGAKAVELLKKLRPYRGGTIGLRGLHDLDVMDKHQALVPIIGTVVIDLSGRVPNADPATKDQLTNWPTRIDHDGQLVVSMPAGWGPRRGTRIKQDYVLTIDLEVGPQSTGRGYEVVAILNELARIVEGVVTEFEKLSSS